MTICGCPFLGADAGSAPAWKKVTCRGSTVRSHAPRGGQAPDQAKTSGPGRCRQTEGQVQRKAPPQAAVVLESHLVLPTPTLPDASPGPPSDSQFSRSSRAARDC